MRIIASGGVEEEHKPPTLLAWSANSEKKFQSDYKIIRCGPKNSKRTVRDFIYASRARYWK